MTSDTKFLSIKSLILWVVMAITSLTLLMSSGVHLYSQISTYRQSLHQVVTTFSEMISTRALELVIDDEGLPEDYNFDDLVAAKLIENVHIYKVIDQTSLDFFASYNKTGIAPVKAQFGQVNALSQATITGNIIEVIRPIKNGEDVLGYVYLRASADILDQLITQSILSTAVVVLICLLICYFLTLKLQSSITAPINDICVIDKMIYMRHQ